MKTIIVLTLCLLSLSLSAQELSVKIEVADSKNGNYWIEVADRNCGAEDNKMNSYGQYFSWNSATKAGERKISDEAKKACQEFRAGGFDDWRLPVLVEVWAIMNKTIAEANYATLKNERDDNTDIIYFPYAGMVEVGQSDPSQIGKEAYFWSNEGKGTSKNALSLNFSKNFKNNPLNLKSAKLSVRCVRNY